MGLTNRTNEKEEIIHDILSYLVDNPGAQDTLEGIVEWWLIKKKVESRMAQVKEALADLEARKLIIELQGRDSRAHYRINPSKIEEIRALLKQHST